LLTVLGICLLPFFDSSLERAWRPVLQPPIEGAQSRCATDFLWGEPADSRLKTWWGEPGEFICGCFVTIRRKPLTLTLSPQSRGEGTRRAPGFGSGFATKKTTRIQKSYCGIVPCRYDVRWVDLRELLDPPYKFEIRPRLILYQGAHRKIEGAHREL
jgi:hypothetical protein